MFKQHLINVNEQMTTMISNVNFHVCW